MFIHGNEELNKPVQDIKHSGINKDVLGRLIIVQMVNIKPPSL